MKTHFLGPWAVGTGKGTGHHVLFTKYMGFEALGTTEPGARVVW